MKLSVIGLGMAGLPIAAVAADNGFDVIGVDINKNRCEMINLGENPIPQEKGLGKLIEEYGGKKLTATSDYNDAQDCTFFIVIVPLFIDEKHNPDFSIMESAFRSLGKILKKKDIVVLETTVPPGTTCGKVKKWLEEESGLKIGEFYLAYSPERIMTGYSVSRLREFPKIIGGINKESGKKAYEVYDKFIGKLSLVSTARVAEFTKVIEGCYRNTNIALANELYKIADKLDIDFFESRRLANHQYCNIHIPSTGVGGHCIPVYPWFLIKEMQDFDKNKYTELLKTSTQVNDGMIHFWTEKIINAAKRIDKPLNEVKICINGISFRNGVKSTYFSRNIELVKLLESKDMKVYVDDKLFNKEEIEKMNLNHIEDNIIDINFDPFKLEITIT